MALASRRSGVRSRLPGRRQRGGPTGAHPFKLPNGRSPGRASCSARTRPPGLGLDRLHRLARHLLPLPDLEHLARQRHAESWCRGRAGL